jgi:S-DNA-T family DNA segregation ATPase FtsK/SpoIIIE
MSNLSIIGRIAADRIREQLEAEADGPPTRILYGIIDLDDDVTCAVAREIAEIATEHGKVEVFVHPKIAGSSQHDVGKAQVSDETATYHRGNTTPDTALTVFSVPKSDTASVRASLAHVSVINSDWLTDDMARWAAAGHPKASDAIRNQLANVLNGLKRSGIVSEVTMLSTFVGDIRDFMTGSEGLPVGEAVRRALPALRLPMNAGDRRIAIEQGSDKAEAFFRKVFDEHRPALYLRSKGDDSLNAVELRKNLDALEISGDIAPPVATAIRALLSNPDVGAGAWLAEQEAVARISWDLVEPLFSGARQRTAATFGEDTLAFFERRHPGTLTDTQQDMLKSLKRDSVRPDDVHQQFFSEFGTVLGDDPKLYRRWEKLVYRKPVETVDLQEGLLSLINTAMPEDASEKSAVYVRLRKSEDLNFWTDDKNTRLCRYLRDRYRGLDKLLAPEIVLDFGRCWTAWDQPDIVENTSESKTAATFEFEAYHVPTEYLFDKDGAQRRPTAEQLRSSSKAQMIWSPKAGAMGLSFSDDLQVLCETGSVVMNTGNVPLLRSVVSANRYNKHGSIQTIDLENQSSINDARHDNNGHFANDKIVENIIDQRWKQSLDGLLSEGILTTDGHAALHTAFDAFRIAYGQAIIAMRSGAGLAAVEVILQGELYGALLSSLSIHAPSPRAIRELWLPLLQIGVAEVTTDRPTIIVCGWNPLRLAEAAVKASQLAGAMRSIQRKAAGFAAEVGPFLRDTVRNLTSSYYMDVGIGIGQGDGTRPELLVETVRSLDLSLLESPRPGETVIADEPADEIADSFDTVAKDYLKLRPHEKANFNTMLLNSESEGLPVRLAEHMAALMEKEATLRCDLVITHDDAAQLRRIYEQQNRRIGYEVDSALTSEAARNFLSRLRVGIISPDVLDENYGKAHDIVILHSVVSRKADIRWARVPAASTSSFRLHVPASHSRKKPFHKGDTTSGTYLTSPSRVPASEAYLDALHGCIAQGATPGDHWLPLQEVEFQSGAVKDLMNKAHRLAEWVMTYDRIADRRLLANDERRILRYYSSPRSDHNVIISTEINAKKLGERLVKDLKIAIPHATSAEIDEIVSAVHRQSASLSGAVVMRGAERVNHAHELLGLVLARRELESLLRQDAAGDMQRTAWFFIDDFIPWLELGSHRADIMAVNFAKVAGKPLLRIAVGEAKFVGYASVGEHKKHSLEQLTSTVATLTRRLASDTGTIDPLAWRSRIADLVLEHIDPFDHIDGTTFEEWLAGLRDGSLPITVSGHSLVYVHDMEEDPKLEAFVPDHEIHPASKRRLLAQWVFGRPSIAGGFKDLLLDSAPSRLHVPPEWPANPYAAAVPEVPPFISDVPELDIEPPASEETETAVQEDVPVEVLVETTHDPVLEQAFVAEMLDDAVEPVDIGAPPPGWLPIVWNALASMRRAAQTNAGDEWLDGQVGKLRDALQTENMHAAIIDRRLTPNSAVLTLDGSKGVTVSWLEKNQTVLLTRYGVDIGRITPQLGKIAVSINRPKRSVVHLSDAWMKRELEQTAPASNGALVLGETELSGDMLYMPLFGPFGETPRAAPHTIISGSTGSGKGILASNLILDLCAFNSPENLRLYMIDPKAGVDYGWMRKLPHLEGEIISDKEQALEVLAGLGREMQERYDKITETDAQNITLYNKLPGVQKMPRIVLFFDEVANWMQDEDFKERASPIINDIATKSRAAGIHLVMIYQRADNQVMSMQLRTNLGNKLVLRLGDEGSSKVAMGERGAEKLLGQGHLIAKLDSDEKTYAQVPFLNPEEEIGVVANAIVMGWRVVSAGRRD